MEPALPNTTSARKSARRRVAFASAVTALALAGVVGIGLPQPQLHAQLKPDSVQTPFGRAPLSFADIVERVKPAVVSVSVTNGGSPKVASKGGKGSNPRDFLPDLPEDHHLND